MKLNKTGNRQNIRSHVIGGVFAIFVAALPVSGATQIYSNHYEKPADVPAGFYAGGSAQHIEDMEVGSLRFGISADVGSIVPPGYEGAIDSVPTDGDPLDQLGYRGHSWFSGSGSVTFTFDTPHTAVGLVWTDGGTGAGAEFYRGNTLLGIIGPLSVADNSIWGTTGEDTFFGATDLSGITSIHVWSVWGGIEVDHVQYGQMSAVPEPSTYLAGLSALGMLGLFGWRNRK